VQLNVLTIECEHKINQITSDDFRKTIISITDNMNQSDKSKISFHLTQEQFKDPSISKIPFVLYGFPRGKKFKIYTFNQDYKILKRIVLELKLYFFIKGQKFKIINTTIKIKNIIPQLKEVRYKTKTPILLFTGNKRKWLDAVIINTKREDLDNILQLKIEKLIIENVRYQMQQLFKNKEYKNFDDIKIKWDEFKLIRLTIRNKTEYGIVGKFISNYSLPYFIGHRIGLGYGNIDA